jgi:hypothetical protein
MHTLRRTFASHLILDLKLDAVQVSKQMGHAKPSITADLYVDIFDKARHADDIRERMRKSAFGKIAESSGGERVLSEGIQAAAEVARVGGSESGGE